MHIRRAAAKDLSAVVDLYDIGRQTMYQQNNTFQWNENYPNVRADTYKANVAMTTTLTHAGFVYCGKVVGHDKTPRDAFHFVALQTARNALNKKRACE